MENMVSQMTQPTQPVQTFQTTDQPVENRYTLHRRFDRMGRLVGDSNMEKLFRTHVMVIGLGGVGSWTAESLMRSGIGKLTVVDFDEICITNANRQLHALQGLVGQKKSKVMAERLRKINPQATVVELSMFYNEKNSPQIFQDRPDYVVDAIDNLTAKAHLLNFCRNEKIPIISATGAAARMNPLSIKLADLADSHTDPLAQQLRKILRSRFDWPEKGPWGVPCAFSDEIPMDPIDLHYDLGQGFKCVCPQGQNDLHSCDKRNMIYGTASFVTGTFGLVMASWVVGQVTGQIATGGRPTDLSQKSAEV